jgi:hypothetical protein
LKAVLVERARGEIQYLFERRGVCGTERGLRLKWWKNQREEQSLLRKESRCGEGGEEQAVWPRYIYNEVAI